MEAHCNCNTCTITVLSTQGKECKNLHSLKHFNFSAITLVLDHCPFLFVNLLISKLASAKGKKQKLLHQWEF